MDMDSGKRDLECVVKLSLEMNCTIVILTRFQEDPMLVHIQLRPEVWSFILLDRDDTGNEFRRRVWVSPTACLIKTGPSSLPK
jgi:hypothetical protein